MVKTCYIYTLKHLQLKKLLSNFKVLKLLKIKLHEVIKCGPFKIILEIITVNKN